MPKHLPPVASKLIGSKQPAKKMNATLLVLMLVMVINSLAYGTIIPLLYPYASRFGINAVGLGWLFASFSLAQLISTPIIGRLSDKYGRKPLLLLCLLGTGASLALFASAQSVAMLFIARIIDGISGGNNSVAQAIIADTTTGQERAKAFGLVGAAFGFGFLFGPAVGGVLSQYGLTVPFWFAAIVAFFGTAVGAILLPETLSKSVAKEAKKESFFTVDSFKQAFFVGPAALALWMSLIVATALNAFIIGFQAFTNDVLHMSSRDIGLLFAAFGLVSMLMQAGGIKYLLKWFKSKKLVLTITLTVCALALLAVATTTTAITFALVLFAFMIPSAPHYSLISALISERTRPEDQGGILGFNQAVMSVGQIFGPLLAGAVTIYSVHWVFVVASALYAGAALATLPMYARFRKPTNL